MNYMMQIRDVRSEENTSILQRVQRQLNKPETFVWLVTSITFVMYVTTITLDQWIVFCHDHNHCTYIGIFYTYEAKDGTLVKGIEATRYVQLYLQTDHYSTPVWVHMSRCFIVCGIITNGYGVIISTAVMLLDYNQLKAPMAINIAVGMFMVVSLGCFLQVGMAQLPAAYEWGYSYIFHWITTLVAVGVSGGWIYEMRRRELKARREMYRMKFRSAMLSTMVGAIKPGAFQSL